MNGVQLFKGFYQVLQEVGLALAPLLVILLLAQKPLLQLPAQKLKNIIKGMAFAFVGLALFLQGVHVGFMPFGEAMGVAMATSSSRWLLIPVGFVLGFAATYAEPAVRVLNIEVEKASGGYIPQQVMLFTLSLGVAASVALSMLRILLGIPVWYFVLPGYILAILLTRYSTPTFIGIAFDSGGVATGPMTVTFVMALAVGVASAIDGRSAIADGFGLIALVAMTPILAVLGLGLLYSRKEKENV